MLLLLHAGELLLSSPKDVLEVFVVVVVQITSLNFKAAAVRHHDSVPVVQHFLVHENVTGDPYKFLIKKRKEKEK